MMFASERRAKVETRHPRYLFEFKPKMKERETGHDPKDGIVCIIIIFSSLVLLVYLFFSAVGWLLRHV